MKDCITLSEVSGLQRKMLAALGLEYPTAGKGDESCVVGD